MNLWNCKKTHERDRAFRRPTVWLGTLAIAVVVLGTGFRHTRDGVALEPTPHPQRSGQVRDPAVKVHSAEASFSPIRAAQRFSGHNLNPVEAPLPAFPRALKIDVASLAHSQDAVPRSAIQLCQFCEPVFYGVDSRDGPGPCCEEPRWPAWRPIPWQVFAHGEYIGPHRTAHVPEYRLRVDDQLEFAYRFTHEASNQAYRLDVGDQLVIESLTDETLNRGTLVEGRGLEVQPDGTITLVLLGQIPVVGRTVEEVRADLESRYSKYYMVPAITVTPLKTNTKLEDLRDTIDSRFGEGGQIRRGRITPEGTIQLPGIGSAPAQGLTLDELEREIEERYREMVGPGVEVTPILEQRAPRFVFVLGEVLNPGRYTLEGPTTAMQSIALAGGWNNGGNLRHVVVFRRAEDWRLMATRLDLNGALQGTRPIPSDEVWLRDSDIVVVPKSPILVADDLIDLVFTRGLYGIFPISFSFTSLSQL